MEVRSAALFARQPAHTRRRVLPVYATSAPPRLAVVTVVVVVGGFVTCVRSVSSCPRNLLFDPSPQRGGLRVGGRPRVNWVRILISPCLILRLISQQHQATPKRCLMLRTRSLRRRRVFETGQRECRLVLRSRFSLECSIRWNDRHVSRYRGDVQRYRGTVPVSCSIAHTLSVFVWATVSTGRGRRYARLPIANAAASGFRGSS